jgi:UDP-N-acetylmuramate--alanine ligase/UDP-N-acetylmuramoyl-L-alanyl-D-glutamate--2,6-diaminopimelate ligase
MDIQDLAEAMNGKLLGNDDFFSIDGFTGKFTFLHEAHTGDIVIREWIDSTGVEMAFEKNIACLITPDPRDGAIETAERLNFPIIIIECMPIAKRFVSQYTKNIELDDINDVLNSVE